MWEAISEFLNGEFMVAIVGGVLAVILARINWNVGGTKKLSQTAADNTKETGNGFASTVKNQLAKICETQDELLEYSIENRELIEKQANTVKRLESRLGSLEGKL